MRTIYVVIILAVILLVLSLTAGGIAGTLGSVTATPSNSEAGATTIYTFSFTTSTVGNGTDIGIPSNGRIIITFPTGFDASGVLIAQSNNSNMTGGLSASGSSNVVTLTRDNTGNNVAGNVSVSLSIANVINHSTSGSAYTVTIETRTNAGTQIDTGTSSPFSITPASLDHFAITTIGTQTAGSSFSITITAKDAQNNTVTSFTGTASLSDLTGTLTPTVTGNFTAGVWSGSVTITKSTTSNTITVTSSGKAGTSNTFAVNPAALDHFTFAT
ncbi:MAG: hypothetical protein ONB05_09040, partial [candidate division KSB1 bacterium]|nr:hypothetical protein [candidate division KSB1 bacterium]